MTNEIEYTIAIFNFGKQPTAIGINLLKLIKQIVGTRSLLCMCEKKIKKTIGFLRKQDVEAARVECLVLFVVTNELCSDCRHHFGHTFMRPLAHYEALCLLIV